MAHNSGAERDPVLSLDPGQAMLRQQSPEAKTQHLSQKLPDSRLCMPRKFQNNLGEGRSTQDCQVSVLPNKHIKNKSYYHYHFIFKMTC